MTREEFKKRLLNEVEGAREELYNEKNVLDLRVSRSPYKVNDDNDIFCISDIDDAYDFIKDAEEWYVDVYENLYGENQAVYTGFTLASWA